ncbi:MULTISPECIES: type II toxin-antitoxin system VapC family toxin [Moorena]|uniref:Ribonuclease VapC n=2 Tax=Moorena producens TaxID=1155739 RepID=A0A1D9FW85_MOOP1|nr:MULTISPECIES: type II toxin-antitoxin system VapC family toxin [Moorena]NEQ13550.1 type II toxin-antitoxin system VapC family toxin [Moorena sp. SIO3E2]AOY79575.1 type II toxin-antitoxin system VapC family toxin [Moorena producens JHB]EGJ33745.1 PIN domain nucleic acid-binding protein [Moorena producens 3L]NEP33528.1 type II toxin-antitoxin system VapC family toxin [Moorena sp. SIO3B2]NEP68054.1 type II toxin-antitoxin system VapC family toxin [Moorena sp. SIO3A5]
MSYLLDTNVCIRLLNNTSPAVTSRLATEQPENIFISSITEMELYYGAYRSTKQSINLALLQRFFSQFTILPLDSNPARIAGQIRADLAAMGTPIGPYDLQIAAIALANNLIVVTHNTAEFSRVRGLQIEDWELD